WGNMLNEGRTYLETAPWISVFPGIAIMVTVLAFNLLGDGLRDVLDPSSPCPAPHPRPLHRRNAHDDRSRPHRRKPSQPPPAPAGGRPRPGRSPGRPPPRRPKPAGGPQPHLRAGHRGHRARSPARPRALAQPALTPDVQPARALRRADEPDPRAGRVVGGEQGRAHLDLQAAPGRKVPRRPGDDLRRREVHLRPPLREEPG